MLKIFQLSQKTPVFCLCFGEFQICPELHRPPTHPIPIPIPIPSIHHHSDFFKRKKEGARVWSLGCDSHDTTLIARKHTLQGPTTTPHSHAFFKIFQKHHILQWFSRLFKNSGFPKISDFSDFSDFSNSPDFPIF